MREILFRGKRLDNGEWAESEYPYGTMSCGVVRHDFDHNTIGQYTGLTDKCGTKIFEGDIIQNVTEGKTAVVQWFSEYSAFMLWCKSENQVYWLYDNDFHNIEVIGNIYDNPELLGGADDARAGESE